jgi:hypothetical protein
MARKTSEFFTVALSLVYIAGNLSDASKAEGILTEQGVDYALSLDDYSHDSMLGAVFGGVYKGLFVLVPTLDHRRAYDMLEGAGLTDTVRLQEE